MAEQDTTLTGKTGAELEKAIVAKTAEKAEATALPEGTAIAPQKIEEKAAELIDEAAGQLPEQAPIQPAAPIDVAQFEQVAPTPTEAAQIEPAKVGEVAPAQAVAGSLSAESLMQAAQGQLSPESIAVGAVQELDPRATTQYQIAELFKSIEDGKPLPAWAAAPVRNATALMQQRGLGSSSMAAAAAVNAVMESGIPIAAQDAQKYATIQLQNLSNTQQAVMQNAAASAQMDVTNLNNRQAAAANNAKAFLSLDIQNLTNEQQSATISYQGQLQAMLTDAAAENAAEQFNAKSQNEIDMFFSELGTQIESATLNRKAAVEQYNVSQENSMAQFNSQMQTAREQFNSNMAVQIAQSNAQWRRDINTANTATQNAANQVNAQNLLNLSQQAQANLWQVYRDQAAWNLQISENNLSRAHNASLQAMAISANADMYDDRFDDYLIVKTIDNIFPG